MANRVDRHPAETVRWIGIPEKTKDRIHKDTVFSMLALPIFPASRPASIVGADELNFCVRDGNRWTLIAINTNFFGWDFSHHLC